MSNVPPKIEWISQDVDQRPSLQGAIIILSLDTIQPTLHHHH